jgi:large subunit ribosomal protein L29
MGFVQNNDIESAMKASDIRGMSDEQIATAVKDTEKHLFNLRFQSATDKLETPSEIRKAKRDIARLATEVRARELKALAAVPAAKIDAMVATLEQGGTVEGARPFTSRRQPLRALKRLQTIQANRKAVTK